MGVSNIVLSPLHIKHGKWKNPKLTAISAPLCPYPPKLWSVVCSLLFLLFRCLTVCVFEKHKLQPYHPYSASAHPNCGQWSVSFFSFLFRCLTVCAFEKHKLQPYHPYSASVHPNCGQWSQRRSRGLIIEKLLFASSTAFLTFLLLIFNHIQSIENLSLKNQFLFLNIYQLHSLL